MLSAITAIVFVKFFNKKIRPHSEEKARFVLVMVGVILIQIAAEALLTWWLIGADENFTPSLFCMAIFNAIAVYAVTKLGLYFD